MASKSYRFDHKLGLKEATKRADPVLAELASKYGLTREDQGGGKYRLSRTGVEASIRLTESTIEATVDLNWLLEKTVRLKLEDTLHRRITSILQ
jgi:putative polyhydroxyalkanoate system protein